MKPFVFRLQTALDITLREEDKLKEKLNELTCIYNDNLSCLKGLEIQMKEIQKVLRREQQDTFIDTLAIETYQNFIPFLSERIHRQEEITEKSRVDMERIRERLLETMRSRKIMEKLKAKQYKEYLQECLREEQKQIDEMATIRFTINNPAVQQEVRW